MKPTIHLCRIARIAIAAGVFFACSAPPVAQAADKAEAHNQELWRNAIARVAAPAAGCFHASYPSLAWEKVECTVAPNIPFMPRGRGISQTTGKGTDWVAKVPDGKPISAAGGAFAKVRGVTIEEGQGGVRNEYSLQLNSNFFVTPACDDAADPAECLGWEQFIYSSGAARGQATVFIQYWLLNYNKGCPPEWNSFGGDCYMNSPANGTAAPREGISALGTIALTGTAVRVRRGPGADSATFIVGEEADGVFTEADILDLADHWNEAEFNIFGDGGGTEANFNSGSSLWVIVQVSNGTTSAPACVLDAGTSGETNNLTLYPTYGPLCAVEGGDLPYILFIESN